MSGLPWDGEEVRGVLAAAVNLEERRARRMTGWKHKLFNRRAQFLRALLAALPEIKEALAYVAAGDLFDQAVGREEEEYCIRLECEAMERYRAARAVRLAKGENGE